MSEPQQVTIDGIDLEAFEKALYVRNGTPEDYERCAKALWETLGKVRKGASFWHDDHEMVLAAHTRMASAITSLFCDPKFSIGQQGFMWLCAEHVTLHSIFRASAFGSMDHILAVLATRDGAQLHFSGPQAILLFLLCWGLESSIDLDFDMMYRAAPEATHAAMIGMLAVGCTHSEVAYRRRVHMMKQLHILSAQPLPDPLVLAAGDLYMHSTYCDFPEKHAVKPVVNKLLRGIVERQFPAILDFERSVVMRPTAKPTICVPVEWFGSHHAMYRCYANAIQQLREKFHVVCIYRDTEIDEGGKAAFDEAIRVPGEGVSIADIAGIVERLRPDIMFYPSVGMAAWYVALSNFRLAPIQIACPGHPASTFSEVIDYLVSDGELFGDERRYSEKLIRLPRGTARYIPRPKAKANDIPWKNQRIAVPAMATKIIPPFLDTLRTISAAHTHEFVYHFLPNLVGMSHFQCERDIKRWLPGSVVHPRAGYQEYIDNLTACDFALATWPFGGTNSTVDCLQYGVPVICREGDEIHQRSDAAFLRRMRMPEWMIAKTEQQYINAALRMLDGANINMPTPAEVEAEFFGDGPLEVRGGFVRAFWNIWEKHLGKA